MPSSIKNLLGLLMLLLVLTEPYAALTSTEVNYPGAVGIWLACCLIFFPIRLVIFILFAK
jgi:hypothetical protein